jgi:DNA (cytosine-5)-methyltransferase 1
LIDPEYTKTLETKTYKIKPQNIYQKWFRTDIHGKVLGKGNALTEQEYSNHSPRIVEKFTHMILHNGEIPKHMQTKKFAQKVLPKTWGSNGPSITATSLPEDYVHFSQPRSLTVREWARLQTFPDWYMFEGPRTTGGRRRAGNPAAGIWERDVPKYTQIGNAVPVLLAKAIGQKLATILRGVK